MPAFDMMELETRLRAIADPKYAAFSESLIPGAENTSLGVRLPQLRAIGREIARGDWRGFLEASRTQPLFEARMLHAIVLGSARCDAAERARLIDLFLPHVDNWSVCDTLCTSLKPKGEDLDRLFDFVCQCARSEPEFRKRFGLVALMGRYHLPPYIRRTMEIYRGFRHEGYYTRMGAAWGLATLWLYAREDCLAILEGRLWDPFTHNKAIQKLCESYRVSEEDKALARSLRRKEKS